MNDRDRIKLAEFCGFKWKAIGTEFAWEKPNGGLVGTFRPDTDADDLSTLIRALYGSGHQVCISINFPSIGDFVRVISTATGTIGEWHGDDYKQGVCELALKVIADVDRKEQSND